MSVLQFPRIYFKGYMEWDPCTFNNNDWQEFPTYDGGKAALNWDFLSKKGITEGNFQTTLRPYAIKLTDDKVDQPPGPRVPAEWNMFGSHSVGFVQYNDKTTLITGGATGYNAPITNDPLIGTPVVLSGNNPPALVDTNPSSFWSSQIYWDTFSFGSGDCVITGRRSVRMHSRWLNLARIASPKQALTGPASGVSCCFQTGILWGDITSWPLGGVSALADALKTAVDAQGIMIRFAAYVNLYFKNGIFNDISPAPDDYGKLADALATAWQPWFSNGDAPNGFSNPCYSHIVGVIGPWFPGELASAPGGRYLTLSNNAPSGPIQSPSQSGAAASSPVQTSAFSGHAVALSAGADSNPNPYPLGPLVASVGSVDSDTSLLSLDLNSTIPENGDPNRYPSDLTKADFGPLTVGVLANGEFNELATIDYTQYSKDAYEATAGIVDVTFPSSMDGIVADNMLVIQAENTTAFIELPYSAQTDSRGIYLNEKEEASFRILVLYYGAPAANANVVVAKYGPSEQTPANFGDLNLVPTGNDNQQTVRFTTGKQSTATVTSNGDSVETDITVVSCDENGFATVGIKPLNSGFLVLGFFPYGQNDQQPLPVYQMNPPGPGEEPMNTWPSSVTYQYYATVRVLPFDDDVPQKFVDLWNNTWGPVNDTTAAWEFIYGPTVNGTGILYLYDQIFSVMISSSGANLNLGSYDAVTGALGGIWNRIAYPLTAEDSGAMPITRDLSAGKRLTLQLWIYLVANQYNVPDFNVNSIPAGWHPGEK